MGEGLNDAMGESYERFASDPQRIFNANFANFLKDPDLYRTGNADYSKQELIPAAQMYLEKNGIIDRPVTLGEIGGEPVTEVDPALKAKAKDFLMNTDAGQVFTQAYRDYVKASNEQIEAIGKDIDPLLKK
ncbi:MAG: hypothetical protein LBU44_06095, partial [Mediterranea sp.]|nr:hypothetical protein [Mediterranea sp.]